MPGALPNRITDYQSRKEKAMARHMVEVATCDSCGTENGVTRVEDREEWEPPVDSCSPCMDWWMDGRNNFPVAWDRANGTWVPND